MPFVCAATKQKTFHITQNIISLFVAPKNLFVSCSRDEQANAASHRAHEARNVTAIGVGAQIITLRRFDSTEWKQLFQFSFLFIHFIICSGASHRRSADSRHRCNKSVAAVQTCSRVRTQPATDPTNVQLFYLHSIFTCIN